MMKTLNSEQEFMKFHDWISMKNMWGILLVDTINKFTSIREILKEER